MMLRRNKEAFTSVSLVVKIEKGRGQFLVPQSFKDSINETFCTIHSIECLNNHGHTYYLTCNVSYFKEQENVLKRNILQQFSSAGPGVVYFTNSIIATLLQTPHRVDLFVSKWKKDNLEMDDTFSGNIVLELFGYREL